MFPCAFGRNSLSNDETMQHFETLLTGAASSSVHGFVYCRDVLSDAWSNFGSYFGPPIFIILAQLNGTLSYPTKKQNFKSLVEFAEIVRLLVGVSWQFGCSYNLISSSMLKFLTTERSLGTRSEWFKMRQKIVCNHQASCTSRFHWKSKQLCRSGFWAVWNFRKAIPQNLMGIQAE